MTMLDLDKKAVRKGLVDAMQRVGRSVAESALESAKRQVYAATSWESALDRVTARAVQALVLAAKQELDKLERDLHQVNELLSSNGEGKHHVQD